MRRRRFAYEGGTHMQRTIRTWIFPLAALLIATLAVVATACGGGDSGAGAGQLAPNQELRLRIAADPATFDPQLAIDAHEISVAKQLFRGLFTYDEELNVVPAVAAELPAKENGGISADGLTYTIALRPDAMWSDGRPVTAGDFVYAFQRLFDPEAGAQGYYYQFYTAIEGAEAFASGDGGSAEAIGVTAIDDTTLQITLTHEQPTLPTLLALWPASPLRQDIIEQYGDAWTEPGHLVGNGPFVLAEYAPEDRIVLERNANYTGAEEPTLARLVYRIIADDSAALIAYENGEIDVTAIPAVDAERYQGNSEQVRYAQLETYAVQYNDAQPPFDDPLVRQAFSRAIDRDAYVAAVLHGVGEPAVSWLPPGVPGYDAAVGQELGFDPDAARSLLAEAGYPNGAGFPSVTFMVADDEDNRLTAEFLQDQLKQTLNVDIDIQTVEQGLFYDRYFESDFQVTWLSWFADYGDPENWLPQQFASDGSLNVIGYSNPQVDDLLARAAVELDQQARVALYDEAHRMIIAGQALTPIYHPQGNYLVKANVAGLITTALDAEPGDWFVSSVRILENGAPPASEPDE
jgi:oligopeptide transport system substrate-binding protein